MLIMRGITKAFGGNRVLDRVDLEVSGGRVHALIGGNGAGKSTLVKILSGVHQADAGQIILDGKEVAFRTPADALRHGIAMVYQEPTLAPHLTVAENIFLGREPMLLERLGVVDRTLLVRKAEDLILSHGFEIDPRAKVSSLSLAQRQLVEVARALVAASKVLVIDEATASLSEKEAAELFAVIRKLKSQGLAIIYISHRLEELKEIADDVTVLRDGLRVFSGKLSSVDTQTLIRYMVGRELKELYPKRPRPRDQVILRVEGLSRDGVFADIDFELRAGQIIGIAGVVGSGQIELARAIFGALPATVGRLVIDGLRVLFDHPRRAVASGIGFLTEDRKATGMFPTLTVSQNITLANLGALVRYGRLDLRREEQVACEQMRALNIRALSSRQRLHTLSGGNQQKTLLARWLFARSRILLLAEPTRGVDAATRAEIYRVLAQLAEQGVGMIMISSDLGELCGLCHEILVMRRGRIIKRFGAEEATQQELLRWVTMEEAEPRSQSEEARIRAPNPYGRSE